MVVDIGPTTPESCHEGVVEFEELLDCFELLEDALIELLERRRENLDAKAQRIIDRRGKNP